MVSMSKSVVDGVKFMIDKPINQIIKSDIENLVSTKVAERRTLEYKQKLPDKGDPSREFLYDVSSFANAGGGDMIFGITDERDSDNKATGLPASAEGVTVGNVGDAIARLENLVRDGVDPRIQGIEWQPVNDFSIGPVLVMRIPKSWTSPHMVIHGGVTRFYSRNSTGKYPLDVAEIRSAFLSSSAVGTNLKRFRLERITKAIEDDLPVALGEGAKMFLHLVPLSALDPNNARDVAKQASTRYAQLCPMHASGWAQHYNFDGLLVTAAAEAKSYVQVFRSGSVEACDGELFKWTQNDKVIPSTALEETVLKALPHYLGVQKEIGIPLPIVVMLTLVGVKGFTMSIPQRFIPFNQCGMIDRDVLQLPEVMLDSYDTPQHTFMRPIFDTMWQAAGFEGSLNYDEKGNWIFRI
jgi:hypothetical protein